MDMRVVRVGMKCEGVVEPIGEHLAGEGAGRIAHDGRLGLGRHGQDQRQADGRVRATPRIGPGEVAPVVGQLADG